MNTSLEAEPESRVEKQPAVHSPVRARTLLPFFLVVACAGFWFAFSDMPKAILSYRGDITYLFGQHIRLVAISAGLAVASGLSVGIILSRPVFNRVSELVLQIFNLGTTIPTLAVLALSMTLLGIGLLPAVFGLWAATLLPIVRNTYTGLKSTPAHLLDAATGAGMTPAQIFFHVEFPNSLFVILSGIRTALAINIGTAPLAFLIGAGGWGELIFTGIALNDLPMMLAGAIPTALMAVFADFLLARLQYLIVPRGINPLR
ncbi:ABC transporter permease [Roseibium sp. M-1]